MSQTHSPGDQLPTEATEAITFRPLASTDFPSIGRWLADSDVARWWPEGDLSLEAMVGKYQPIVDGTDPVRGFIIVLNGVDAGYIQAYRIDDHPDYARQLDLPGGAVATDLFLGEPPLRGKGWAVPLLRHFVTTVVFGEYGADLAVIAPAPSNERAIHVYERVGFRWLKTVAVVDEDTPTDSGDEYVMVLARTAYASP